MRKSSPNAALVRKLQWISHLKINFSVIAVSLSSRQVKLHKFVTTVASFTATRLQKGKKWQVENITVKWYIHPQSLRTMQSDGRRKCSVRGLADGAGWAAELSGNPVLRGAGYSGRDLVAGVVGRHSNTEVSTRAAAEGTWEGRTYYTQSEEYAEMTSIRLLSNW